jgi:aspartate/glutamate racemase
LGGLHSASLLLHSVISTKLKPVSAGEWEKGRGFPADAAIGLQNAGAQGIVLCTNTMHKIAGQIEARSMCRLHIADATGRAIVAQKQSKWRCWARATPWSRIFTVAV